MVDEKHKPLLVALKAEREGFDFYTRMSARSKNPTGQAMYKKLCEEEKKHVKILENRLKKLKIPADYTGLEEKATILTELDFTDPELSDLEIVEAAIADEIYSHQFYKKQAGLVINPEAQAMYRELAQDEENHRKTLEAEAARLRKR